jgi:hypothetical protein
MGRYEKSDTIQKPDSCRIHLNINNIAITNLVAQNKLHLVYKRHALRITRYPRS